MGMGQEADLGILVVAESRIRNPRHGREVDALRAYDYSTLRKLIGEHFGTQAEFAAALGISRTSLYMRLAGKLPFQQGEIKLAQELLGVPDEALASVFFRERR